ncbi:uromodulin-like isoform X2 [Ruditapes philippinarum]|uniref:uromodulin-like isoform X2 n=1 Tax=Ruditapes philippinarum TaxID=129788 RepID=UPI00295AC046|nr:uromodulin-like isoform X2 [Ruditapes philippinarum]
MYLIVYFAVIFAGMLTDAAAIDCFSSDLDVCNAEIPEFPNLSSRDPTFVITNKTSNATYCDVYSITTSQWYKSEARMSVSCPGMYMCGTKFPIWMVGKNPEPEEGVVNRTSCLRDFDSCCLNIYKMTAVNCGEFMAYCIIDLPSSCHQRYCFDNSSIQITIALSVICLLIAVICGLLIVIIRNKRIAKIIDEPEKDKKYEKLEIAAVGANEKIYPVLTQDTIEQGKFGVCFNKTDLINVEKQLTTAAKRNN